MLMQPNSVLNVVADPRNCGVRNLSLQSPRFLQSSANPDEKRLCGNFYRTVSECFLAQIMSIRNGSAGSLTALFLRSRQKAKCTPWRMQYHARAFGQAIEELNEKVSCSDTTLWDGAVAKLVAIVADNISSPLRNATWEDVMLHMVQRLKWVNEGYELIVISDKALKSEKTQESYQNIIGTADILIVVSVREYMPVKWILEHTRNVSNIICFDSSLDLQTRLGGTILPPKDMITKFRAALPRNGIKKDLKVLSLVEEAWTRQSSDDIRFVLLILIDAYVSPVECLKSLRATDFRMLRCMVQNCGPQILACLLDPNCRKALSCLTNCAATDQVCSYKCIASYESSQLESFSLCVLQKHNCLGLTADIPSEPNVQPLKVFRGQPLNHDIAEDLFIGWLGKLKWSWRVVAGQNPAYDHFPCQFQIFYRGKGKSSMWYDPVFRVRTLDERLVWRRRHYRVKRGIAPGTFFFSVLDNGVVSREYWRIVDVTDELTWGLFFYSGAAAAAGQSYTGAVLVTPDGEWPANSEQGRLNVALEKCGIKQWELYMVNNAGCEGPPLELPADISIGVTSLWG